MVSVLAGLGAFVELVCADKEIEASETTTLPVEDRARHRIDLTALFLDEIEEDTATALFGYTYNLNPRSNLSFALPFEDSDFGREGGSGIGDLNISFSYVPSVSLSAKPWVPRTIGSGLSMLLPTASADVGGLDTTIVTPFLGMVFPVGDKFAIYPLLAYAHSLEETNLGTDVRLATAEVGLTYVSDSGFWISYFPAAIHDLETDGTAVNHRWSVGKEFFRWFGLSFDYSRIERENFTIDLPAESGFNTLYELNVHFTF